MEKARELAVLDLMMAVHPELLSVQSGVIASVLNINQGGQNVDQALAKVKQNRADQAGKD